MKVIVALAAVLASVVLVQGRPNGAPQAACANLRPQSPHSSTEQTDAVPYAIDLTPFKLVINNTNFLQYTPGYEYNLRFYGQNNMMFRGILIQARDRNNGMVGGFESSDPLTQLSLCTEPTDGITHTSPVDKTEVYFNWTAPMDSTGPIRFRFAVVQVRDTWWGDEASNEIGPPGMPIKIPMGGAVGMHFTLWTTVSALLLAFFFY